MERLQKVIAKAGIASRRHAEELIRAGRVKVNGKTVTEMGIQVAPSDIVSVDGKELQNENSQSRLFGKEIVSRLRSELYWRLFVTPSTILRFCELGSEVLVSTGGPFEKKEK